MFGTVNFFFNTSDKRQSRILTHKMSDAREFLAIYEEICVVMNRIGSTDG